MKIFGTVTGRRFKKLYSVVASLGFVLWLSASVANAQYVHLHGYNNSGTNGESLPRPGMNPAQSARQDIDDKLSGVAEADPLLGSSTNAAAVITAGGINGIPFTLAGASSGQCVVYNAGAQKFVASTCPQTSSTGGILNGAVSPYLNGLVGTSTVTNGTNSILDMNWNLQFDARTFGCHGDYLQDKVAGITSAAPYTLTLNDSAGLFQSTDCSSTANSLCTAAGLMGTFSAACCTGSGTGTCGSGCTGTSATYGSLPGKVFRIEDRSNSLLSSQTVAISAGAITGYNSSNSVQMSQAPNMPFSYTADSSYFVTEWATADDSCLAAIKTFVGSTTTARGISVKFSMPVAQTQEWNLGPVSGSIEGSGCGTSSTSPGSPIIWFGTTSDVPQFFVEGFGMSFRNMCWQGSSAYPPETAVMFAQPNSSPNDSNLNVLEDSVINPSGALGSPTTNEIPPDYGSGIAGTLASNMSAGGTSMVVSSGLSAYIGPNEIIYIVDPTAGSETVRVASTYVRGSSSTITFTSGFPNLLAHTTTNATLVIPITPYVYGFTDGAFTGTQSDLNQFRNVLVSDTDACGAVGAQATDGTMFNGVQCSTSVMGFIGFGGEGMSINNSSYQGVALYHDYYGSGSLGVHDEAGQNGGTHAQFGPNFVFGSTGSDQVVNGSQLFLLEQQQASAGVFTLIGSNIGFEEGSTVDTEGDEIEVISGSPNIHIDGAYLVDDADGAPPNGVPAIYHFIGTPNGAADISISYRAGNPTRHFGAIESLSGGAAACRHYRFHDQLNGANQVPDDVDTVWCGTSAYNDSMAARTDNYGQYNINGVTTISQLPVPVGSNPGYTDTASVGGTSPPCKFATLGGSSGADYFYIAVNVQTDQAGNYHYGPVPATALHLYCPASTNVTSSNPGEITGWAVAGMDTQNLYKSPVCNWSGSDSCAAPSTSTACGSGGFCLMATQRVNTTPSGGFVNNTFTDVGAALSGASVPTVNTTGQLIMSGAAQLVLGNTTVAALPTCNSQTQYTWLTVTNNNAACTFLGTPTAGGSHVCPAFCDGVSGWLIH